MGHVVAREHTPQHGGLTAKKPQADQTAHKKKTAQKDGGKAEAGPDALIDKRPDHDPEAQDGEHRGPTPALAGRTAFHQIRFSADGEPRHNRAQAAKQQKNPGGAQRKAHVLGDGMGFKLRSCLLTIARMTNSDYLAFRNEEEGI